MGDNDAITGRVVTEINGVSWTNKKGTAGDTLIAASADSQSVEGLKAQFPSDISASIELYNLWIGDDQASSNQLSGEGWSLEITDTEDDDGFKRKKFNLTLDGFHYSGEGHWTTHYTAETGTTRYRGCILFTEDKATLTINLKGNNTLRNTTGTDYVGDAVGIAAFGYLQDVVITGTGSLLCQGRDGIWVETLTIVGGDVTAQPNPDIYWQPGCFGVRTEMDLNITGGKLTANGGNGERVSCGIIVDDTMTVTGGTVIAKAGTITKNGGFGTAGITTHKIHLEGGEVIAAAGKGPGVVNEGITGSEIWIKKGAKLTASGSSYAINESEEVEDWQNHVWTDVAGLGWTDEAGTTGQTAIQASTSPQNLRAYKKLQFPAEPEAATYTVTVTDDGHGAASASPSSGANGTAVTLIATPGEGYLFKEWQAVSGGVTVTDNKFTIGNANVEIRAIFQEKPADMFTVTFDANGGTGTMDPVTVKAGETLILPECGFTAPNAMAFDAWIQGAPGTALTVTADIMVRARWKVLTEITKIVADGLTSVPAELAQKYATVEALRQDLMTRLTVDKLPAQEENTAFYDVKLMVSTDGGNTWVEATEENFPANGIMATLPYPEGTGRATHNFAVAHMFTKGARAGEIETPQPTKTDGGIQVTLTGLSPVAVAWAKIPEQTEPAPVEPAPVEPAPAEPAAPVAVYEPASEPAYNMPKTGDTADLALYAGALLLGAAGLYVLKKRKQKQ